MSDALSPFVALMVAASNPNLLARCEHADWVVIDAVSCARCRAERALVTAAQERLRAQGGTDAT